MKKEEKKENKNDATLNEKTNLKAKKRNNYIAEKKNDKKDKKNKVNIFKSIVRYFKGVGKEIKRIKWTSAKELVKYSIAAIVFVLFFGLYFYAIDWLALLVRSLAK